MALRRGRFTLRRAKYVCATRRTISANPKKSCIIVGFHHGSTVWCESCGTSHQGANKYRVIPVTASTIEEIVKRM